MTTIIAALWVGSVASAWLGGFFHGYQIGVIGGTLKFGRALIDSIREVKEMIRSGEFDI